MRKTVTVYSGIAILFVLLAHSNAFYLHHINSSEKFILMKAFMKVINIAVPMFVFIAGYKYELTKKNRNIKQYFVKKVNNVIKPTIIISLIWIVVLLTLSILKKGILGESIYITKYLKILLYRVFNICIGNNDIYQFWYIPMYILIVFTYPNIEYYINKKNRIVLFLFLAIIQVLGSLYTNIFTKHPLDFIYYYLIFEIGILFYKKEKSYTKKKKIICIIFTSFLLINLFINNSFFNVIITKLVVYPSGVIVFYYISEYIKNIKILNILGKYSFYIYVLHEPIILSTIGKIIKNLGLYKYWIWVPIISCFAALICIYLYKLTVKFKIGQIFWNKNI